MPKLIRQILEGTKISPVQQVCEYGTGQILSQIAVLFAVPILAQIRGSRVSERRVFPFKNLSAPM